jgi:hypothetical protein
VLGIELSLKAKNFERASALLSKNSSGGIPGKGAGKSFGRSDFVN